MAWSPPLPVICGIAAICLQRNGKAMCRPSFLSLFVASDVAIKRPFWNQEEQMQQRRPKRFHDFDSRVLQWWKELFGIAPWSARPGQKDWRKFQGPLSGLAHKLIKDKDVFRVKKMRFQGYRWACAAFSGRERRKVSSPAVHVLWTQCWRERLVHMRIGWSITGTLSPVGYT